MFSSRDRLDNTFCIVPQRFLSSALDRSVMPLVARMVAVVPPKVTSHVSPW